ncbi:hypothetical protein AAFF_G00141340 [Aldrovandia affinis]|uniref:RING-type domain-containing protein n=1 Tax=Aldrovandia affinis TaxID=143900 RepID=A0AAD7X300_9TELE|nr:hypothetical protein AAFF_G00141340 [Aldrovandia affinis]
MQVKFIHTAVLRCGPSGIDAHSHAAENGLSFGSALNGQVWLQDVRHVSQYSGVLCHGHDRACPAEVQLVQSFAAQPRAQSVGKEVAAEFEKLHWPLRDTERVRLAAVLKKEVHTVPQDPLTDVAKHLRSLTSSVTFNYDTAQDPVVLRCSHSVCRPCLDAYWRDKPPKACPCCRRRSSTDSPPANLALRSIVESYQKEQTEKARPGAADGSRWDL